MAAVHINTSTMYGHDSRQCGLGFTNTKSATIENGDNNYCILCIVESPILATTVADCGEVSDYSRLSIVA